MGPDGILSGSRVEIVANSSTSGTAVVDEIVAAGAERRVRMVDCPISGGPEAARKAALSVMISGTPADIERLRPPLDTFAGKITAAGEKTIGRSSCRERECPSV